MRLSPDELREYRRCYRETFGTYTGQAVLTDLLGQLDFFAAEPEPARFQVAVGILHKLGAYHVKNTERVVEALLAIANDKDLEEETE